MSRIHGWQMRRLVPSWTDMETYLTETGVNHGYSVRVMRPDGKVLVSGNFPNLGMAHRWIDDRQKADGYINRFARRETSRQ